MTNSANPTLFYKFSNLRTLIYNVRFFSIYSKQVSIHIQAVYLFFPLPILLIYLTNIRYFTSLFKYLTKTNTKFEDVKKDPNFIYTILNYLKSLSV